MIAGFSKNPGLKILAFVIAFTLWILVSGEQDSVQVYSVPLDFALAKDRILAGDVPESVQVRVRGSGSILRGLMANDLQIPVDLTQAAPGEKTSLALDAGSVHGVPSGVAVEAVIPERVTVSVERKISRTIRVSPRLEGSPAPGFRMQDFEADPDRITIEGPEGEVSRISLAYTEPIPLVGKVAEFTATVNTAIEAPRVRVLEARPIKVKVRIVKDETKG